MRITTFSSTWKLSHKLKANQPITITLWLYETIPLKRIILYQHIIPKQFGFKIQHSTCHQIQRISEIIVHGFENKQYTTAVFCDLTQAFDKVWHHGLKIKLKALNFPTYYKKNNHILHNRQNIPNQNKHGLISIIQNQIWSPTKIRLRTIPIHYLLLRYTRSP